MASSHAPSLFYYTFDGWEKGFQRLDGHRPKPPETAIETKEEIEEGRVPRFKADFAALKQQLADFNPDVLIIVGGDQGEWFDDSNKPQVMVYAGETMWGVHNTTTQDFDPPLDPTEHYDKFRIDLKIDQELARQLQEGLVREGVDAALSTKQNPLGRNPLRGSPHAFMYPTPHLLPRLDLPVVPVFIITTEKVPGALTGQRCLELGRAIAKVCETSGKRIAIYGSGGMSHDPGGPRSGWVDEAARRLVPGPDHRWKRGEPEVHVQLPVGELRGRNGRAPDMDYCSWRYDLCEAEPQGGGGGLPSGP